MAVTAFQSEVLRLIARSRKDGEGTHVAGGLAINHHSCAAWPRIIRWGVFDSKSTREVER